MAVLHSYDNRELVINCRCGCDEGIHFSVEKDKHTKDIYCIAAFTNGNFYSEQGFGFIKKLRKIIAIIFNKDFYYSDIVISGNDLKEFQKWISQIGE